MYVFLTDDKRKEQDVPTNPRMEIEQKRAQGDIEWLLGKAGELHGHFCPFLSLGVKASVLALDEMGSSTEGINEELLAIVEVNNCFTDGIQMVTGCTFGNNSLIYKDFGKNAFTLAKRGGEAIRVSILPGYPQKMAKRVDGAQEMFERFIQKREIGTKEEMTRFKEVWEMLSFIQLQVPTDEQFKVEHVTVSLPEQAPILQSVTCSDCGESVMESHIRVLDGRPVCIPCSNHEYFVMEGRGMHMTGHAAS